METIQDVLETLGSIGLLARSIPVVVTCSHSLLKSPYELLGHQEGLGGRPDVAKKGLESGEKRALLGTGTNRTCACGISQEVCEKRRTHAKSLEDHIEEAGVAEIGEANTAPGGGERRRGGHVGGSFVFVGSALFNF
jgi:hypothetical protein